MWETRDLGIKWPLWHTLIFGCDRSIDMRYVCPKDLKKMLLQQARKVYWKKWAKHEYGELKEGVWLEPALALLSKKTKEDWTEKRRNVARKYSWKEAGCSKDLVCRMKVNAKPVTRRKAQKNTGSTIAQNDMKSERRSLKFSESGSKKPNFKERVEVAKRKPMEQGSLQDGKVGV